MTNTDLKDQGFIPLAENLQEVHLHLPGNPVQEQVFQNTEQGLVLTMRADQPNWVQIWERVASDEEVRLVGMQAGHYRVLVHHMGQPKGVQRTLYVPNNTPLQ